MLEFIRTTKQLRKAQKKFEKRKTKANREQVKELESKVDEMLNNFKVEQLEIFNHENNTNIISN